MSTKLTYSQLIPESISPQDFEDIRTLVDESREINFFHNTSACQTLTKEALSEVMNYDGNLLVVARDEDKRIIAFATLIQTVTVLAGIQNQVVEVVCDSSVDQSEVTESLSQELIRVAAILGRTVNRWPNMTRGKLNI